MHGRGLDVYHLPYEASFPVVWTEAAHRGSACADSSGFWTRTDLSITNSTVQLFVEIEPLTGQRHVEVTETRKPKIGKLGSKQCRMNATLARSKSDWSWTTQYARHRIALRDFSTARSATINGIHYTPKHGSWLIAERTECLKRTMPEPRDITHMRKCLGKRSQ